VANRFQPTLYQPAPRGISRSDRQVSTRTLYMAASVTRKSAAIDCSYAAPTPPSVHHERLSTTRQLKKGQYGKHLRDHTHPVHEGLGKEEEGVSAAVAAVPCRLHNLHRLGRALRPHGPPLGHVARTIHLQQRAPPSSYDPPEELGYSRRLLMPVQELYIYMRYITWRALSPHGPPLGHVARAVQLQGAKAILSTSGTEKAPF
jgi:hypothetical protein